MCQGEHPYIPVPSTAKIEMYYQEYEQKLENVFHVTRAGSWGAESLQALGVQFMDWFETYLAPLMCTTAELTGIKVTDLASESGASIDVSGDFPIHGTATSTFTAPLNVTVCGKWTTASRGRSYRGRTYFPAVPVSLIIGNKLTPEAVTEYKGVMAALHGAIVGASNMLTVVSYCNNKAWRTTGVYTQITGWDVDPLLDSQRRRLTGRGK